MIKVTEHENTSDSKSVNDVSPLSGHILYIQMEMCRITLRDAIIKINSELNQSIGDPITAIGVFIATQFFEEIVSGVKYLHSSSPSIIHRDLKPENIFVTDGRGGNLIKIGDFGSAVIHEHDDCGSSTVSKTKHEMEHTGERGTYAYMAPEVRKSLKYDEKCDIYSLGCIFMDLLCVARDKFLNASQK
jgi:serine/threonine protein kinase